MSIRYVAGRGFDAKTEIGSLVQSLRKGVPPPSIALLAFIDCIKSLDDAQQHGFASVKHKWRETGYGPIYRYNDDELLVAVAVDADLSSAMPDLVIIGAAFVSIPRQVSTDTVARSAYLATNHQNFIGMAVTRYEKGQKCKWVSP